MECDDTTAAPLPLARRYAGVRHLPEQVFYLDIDVDHLLPRVLAYRELDHWESGEDLLRAADRHARFVEDQDALLKEFRSLAAQYEFQTVDARLIVREV